MSRTVLALSPHLDDAVFSCGGTLARLAEAGWRVVIATLFTRSVDRPTGFALACQLDKGLGPEVDYMALRREEDRAALRALGPGAMPVHEPLPEAPHRGYGTAAALFGAVRAEDEIGPVLAGTIGRLVAEWEPALVLAPQAIGGHVDHVQVVRACQGLAGPVLWWRDFPYITREALPAEPFGDRMATLGEVEVALNTTDRDAKEAACFAYASQLGFQFGGPDGMRRRLREAGPVERFRGALPPGLTL